ncbi:MAG: SBBP repeat-containing protein [Acidobacteriota bacterium]
MLLRAFLLATGLGVAAHGWAAVSAPLFFIEDAPNRFLIKAPETAAVFTPDGVEFQTGVDTVRVKFRGVKGTVAMQGVEPMGLANFVVGQDPKAWRTGLPTHRKIRYANLYSGIDLIYSGIQGRLKSEYRVAAGADLGNIQVEYSQDLSMDAEGRLHAGNLIEAAPEIFQESAAGRVLIVGRYRLLDARIAGFEVEAYDRALPLVIDPAISYATYMGGSGLGAVTGVALDSAGNLYAAGWTEALNFPIVLAEQAVSGGGVDVFVVKLNPSGSALLYATYIGGRGDDRAAAIAVNSSGEAYVTGATTSTNFPLASPVRPTLGGSKNAFVLKLNSVGNTLLFSTYLGGTTYDLGTAIAVDAAGRAYIAGDTQSANFPVIGGIQGAIGGGFDSFVTKLNSNGTYVFSTFLGGAANEHAGGIALDSSGNVYVAGGTYSINFPLAGAIQTTNHGSQDAFVAKLNASGASLLYSTYLGGSGGVTPEEANGIAVDTSGNAYVAGVTNSVDFPVTAGSLQVNFKGVSDAFVTKINASGTAWVYSTYLGGTDFDWATSIGIDGAGNAYAAGYSSSGDFPQSNPVQAGFGGLYDAFVAKLNPAGNTLGFATWFGGSGSDVASAIAVDANGNMFLGGQTSSVNLPLTGPIQAANNGGSVGWLARLGVTPPSPQIPSAVSVTPSSGIGNAVVFSAQYSDSGGAAALTSVSLLVNTSASTSFACYVTYNPVSQVLSLANDDPASGSQAVTFGGGSQQNHQCIVNGAGSSVSLAGNTLTLNLSLIFMPGFGGSDSVYMYAADAGANTGWVSRGAWTVLIPPPQPSADSVSPNGASGASQAFTFVFSDNQSASNLVGMAMLFNTTNASVTNACDVVYDRNAGTIALVWDNAAGSDPKALASLSVLQNSQCKVGVASAAASGLSQIITVAITFKGPFNGTKNIYMYGSNAGLNTGWVLRGTYLVAAGGLPVANSVVPGAGSGAAQRFSFTVSDQGGAGFLTGAAMLLSSTINTTNACSMVYDRTANVVSLAFDNPANGATRVTPGSNTLASNGQCTVNGTNTTVVIGVTSVVVTVDLAFNANWFGAKNIYLLAAENTINSGFVTVGGWTVMGGAPTADSVIPASGSGTSPNFTFTVSDSASQFNITGMSMLITSGAPSVVTNACYLVYNRTTATIGLYNNGATTLSTKPIGSAANLFNTQCAVGYTVMTTSGNSVSLTINVVFLSFSGPKSVYLQANEPNTNSGWVQRGIWTVP